MKFFKKLSTQLKQKPSSDQLNPLVTAQHHQVTNMKNCHENVELSSCINSREQRTKENQSKPLESYFHWIKRDLLSMILSHLTARDIHNLSSAYPFLVGSIQQITQEQRKLKMELSFCRAKLDPERITSYMEIIENDKKYMSPKNTSGEANTKEDTENYWRNEYRQQSLSP